MTSARRRPPPINRARMSNSLNDRAEPSVSSSLEAVNQLLDDTCCVRHETGVTVSAALVHAQPRWPFPTQRPSPRQRGAYSRTPITTPSSSRTKQLGSFARERYEGDRYAESEGPQAARQSPHAEDRRVVHGCTASTPQEES